MCVLFNATFLSKGILMSVYRTFRTTPEIEKLLEDIPYGKRGAFIKECITCAAGQAFENLKKAATSNGSKGQSEKKTSSSEPQKLSAEAEATTKGNSASSPPTARNTGKLTELWKSYAEKK